MPGTRASYRHLLDLPGGPVPGAPGRVEEHLVEGWVVVEPAARAELGLELAGRALTYDQPAVVDRDAVAELVGLLEVLRREEDRGAARVDAAYLVPDGQAGRRVEPGR